MRAGTSLEAALALKDDEAAYGCSVCQGARWINFALHLYYNRCDHLWSHDDVNHYNFVSDPGHHSYQECLVTLAYSWGQDTGAFPPWQHLLPGSELTHDDAAMEDNIATIAAMNKLERVASYRQLHGDVAPATLALRAHAWRLRLACRCEREADRPERVPHCCSRR